MSAGFAKKDCLHCKGTGGEMMPIDIPGLSIKSAWVDCECVEAEKARLDKLQADGEATRRLLATGIPDRFIGARLTDKPRAGQGAMVKAAQGMAGRSPLGDRGLLFCGGVGSGKTHVAAALMMAFHEKRVSVRWANWSDALLRFRATFGNGATKTEEELHDDFARAAVLFLDDIGAEKTTEFTDNALYQIVNTRYEKMRPTVVTSNLEGDALLESIGARVYRRLTETCDVVNL